MKENKRKTSAGAGTPTEAIDGAACDGTTVSFYQFTTGAERRQGLVEAVLAHGAENAISTAELVKICGFTSTRELQKQIETERLHGALILSRSGNAGGYFLPTEGETGRREIADYIGTLRARALNTLRTLKTASEALNTVEDQEVFF